MPRDLPAERRPAEPWLSSLTDLDAALDGPADFHGIGGFVCWLCFARWTVCP